MIPSPEHRIKCLGQSPHRRPECIPRGIAALGHVNVAADGLHVGCIHSPDADIAALAKKCS